MVSTAKIGNDKKKQIWAGDQIEAVEKIPWRNKKQRTLPYTYPGYRRLPRLTPRPLTALPLFVTAPPAPYPPLLPPLTPP